ncbi:MAG: response regulator [Betaproteobacteria bacterium]|jgi:two-component system chemotaxis response regulator CheY|nr:response regulator [Betaproteobacteria bacterium]NBS93911.1 response regulator [Betaproteobacteria bacterium]NCA24807.1 response regulator [Betaproteobacteria bacterium]NCU85191.1 response regulator [Betaproteobacteria bacterium]NCU95607.1 response regulator [Betaproteobacteria bacterium]
MAKTVLIVDDSASLRMVVNTALTGAGYEVLEADDGPPALELLDGRKINLVVCDINMPLMDGLTVVKTMKERPKYRFTPVIMLTTEWTDEMKMKGKEVGAKGWLVKPFKPEQLLAAVAKMILP